MNAKLPEPKQPDGDNKARTKTDDGGTEGKGNEGAHPGHSAEESSRLETDSEPLWLRKLWERGPHVVMAVDTGILVWVTWRYTNSAGDQLGAMRGQLSTMNDQSKDIRVQASAAVEAANAATKAANIAKSTLDEQSSEFKTARESGNAQFGQQLGALKSSILAASRQAAAAEGAVRVANSSLASARSQFLYEERPWVSLEAQPTPPTYDKANGVLVAFVQANNSGHSPALHVRTNIKMFFGQQAMSQI